MLFFLDRYFAKEENLLKVLTNIYGIGRRTAILLCERVGLTSDARLFMLDVYKLRCITKEVRYYKTDDDLKKFIRERIVEQKKLGTNRGLRLKRGLPVRGQRTHTNAMICRGKQIL